MILTVVLLLVAAPVAWLCWSLRPPRRQSSPLKSEEILERFSADEYRPMETLLSERDFRFLATQPGYRPSLARELRKKRRKVFHAYLDNLTVDFECLHTLAIQSAALAENGGEAMAELVQQKLRFKRSILEIRFWLALSALGIGRVNPTPAIEAFRTLTILAKNA